MVELCNAGGFPIGQPSPPGEGPVIPGGAPTLLFALIPDSPLPDGSIWLASDGDVFVPEPRIPHAAVPSLTATSVAERFTTITHHGVLYFWSRGNAYDGPPLFYSFDGATTRLLGGFSAGSTICGLTVDPADDQLVFIQHTNVGVPAGENTVWKFDVSAETFALMAPTLDLNHLATFSPVTGATWFRESDTVWAIGVQGQDAGYVYRYALGDLECHPVPTDAWLAEFLQLGGTLCPDPSLPPFSNHMEFSPLYAGETYLAIANRFPTAAVGTVQIQGARPYWTTISTNANTWTDGGGGVPIGGVFGKFVLFGDDLFVHYRDTATSKILRGTGNPIVWSLELDVLPTVSNMWPGQPVVFQNRLFWPFNFGPTANYAGVLLRRDLAGVWDVPLTGTGFLGPAGFTQAPNWDGSR